MAKRFQTKDLMISVPGEEVAADVVNRCYFATQICLSPTRHLQCSPVTCGLCTGVVSFPCPGGSCWQSRLVPRTEVFTPRLQAGVATVEDVRGLRAELEATLEALDAAEAELSGPATEAEAAELEAKLEEALEHLRSRKKELGGKASRKK